MMTNHELIEIQKDLEAEMRGTSVERFHRRHERAVEKKFFAESVTGIALLKQVVVPFAAAIDKWVAESMGGGAGRRASAAVMVQEFADTEALAYIFAKSVINMVPMQQSRLGSASRTAVVITSTQHIHDELRLRYFRKNYLRIFKRIMKDCDTRNLPKQRRKELFQKEFRYRQLVWQAEGWDMKDRVRLGARLLEIFRDVTGMIRFEEIRQGKKRRAIVEATPELMQMLKEKMERNEAMFPVYYPMVVPPRRWTNDCLVGSAYLTDNVAPYKFVKRAKVNYLRELENTDISVTVDAVNAIQETPWRVNGEMLEALKMAYYSSMKVDKLPPADDLPLPPKPANLDDDKVRKQNFAECARVHNANRQFISKRITVLQVIMLATKFSKFDRIYFPHDVDSRSRAYPKPQYLNTQGPAWVRSMLEFAEGKPIETEQQVEYIAIAGANAYGHDKLPLEERIQWVWDNEEMFCEIADNWRIDHRWTEADSPFEFLRFCLEWKGLDEHGVGYVSHMPVNFDATCSGLQHFSALLKDRVGGFNVNLTRCAQRQDIYNAVAKMAEETIKADLTNPEKATMAQVALDIGVTRSLAKRPVMIVPYSGTFKAAMKYVGDHYEELADAGVALPLPIEELMTTIVPYVTRHVWDAISKNVVAARKAMDWITSVARIVTSDNRQLPIMWSTPSGFIVQQAKYKMDENIVQTMIDGTMKKITYATDSKTLCPRTNSQSLSPNVIHSFDAAHLQLTVKKALEAQPENKMSFCMIHDSFGVHAADMDVFVHECIKPAFYEMYKDGDLFSKFVEDIGKLRGEGADEFPALPEMGDLDLAEVLESDFFFS